MRNKQDKRILKVSGNIARDFFGLIPITYNETLTQRYYILGVKNNARGKQSKKCGNLWKNVL